MFEQGTVKYMEKNGGFLPLLAALIPAAIGAIGGLAGGISSAVNSTRQTNEQKRHNQELESLTKQQLGSGILSDAVAPIPITGKMLSNALKKLGLGGCVKNLKGAAWGNGLYLEREGNGLFLARQGD